MLSRFRCAIFERFGSPDSFASLLHCSYQFETPHEAYCLGSRRPLQLWLVSYWAFEQGLMDNWAICWLQDEYLPSSSKNLRLSRSCPSWFQKKVKHGKNWDRTRKPKKRSVNNSKQVQNNIRTHTLRKTKNIKKLIIQNSSAVCGVVFF